MTVKTIDIKTMWKAVKAEMEVVFSGMHYTMFLSKLSVEDSEDENVLHIICPDSFTKSQIEKLYLGFIKNSIQKIAKRDYEIILKVGKKTKTEPTFNEPLFKSISKNTDSISEKAIKAGLNVDYTFENFVAGSSNQLAYAIATTIAQNPGTRHNPFFLYSSVGQGKTHLIQAIGHKIIENFPDYNVVYVTGENFTNDLVEALTKGKNAKYTSDQFRKKYRNADVLIIDDIQFIIGKDKTQEEFFHTFNDLFMAKKQIVLASDRPPEEFTKLEDRITSRFKSGIIADIQPPDIELRMAILRTKRNVEKMQIANEILDFIAENISTNIRELEGAYQQVITYAKATGEDMNLDTAKKALEGIIKVNKPRTINLNTIIKAVCNYYTLKQQDLKGKRRNKEIVLPRQVAMYLIYDLTETPFMSIGEVLGGRDHTTIMHGVKKIEQELKSSNKLKQDIQNIKTFILNN